MRFPGGGNNVPDADRSIHSGCRRRSRRLRYCRRGAAYPLPSLVGIRALLMLAAPTKRSCAEVKEIASAHLLSVQAKLADLAKLENILTTTVAQCSGEAFSACPVLDILDGPQPS
jgi:MerR family mercuric resistance operon transcriptional regulator